MPLIMDFLEGRRAHDLYHTYLSPLFETWSGYAGSGHAST